MASSATAMAGVSFSSKPAVCAWYWISTSVFSDSSSVTIAASRAASDCAVASAVSTEAVAASTAALTGSGSIAWSAFCAAKIASRAAATAELTVLMPAMMNTSTWIAESRSDARSSEPWNSARASSIARLRSSMATDTCSADRTKAKAAVSRSRRAALASSGVMPDDASARDECWFVRFALVPARRSEWGPCSDVNARVADSHWFATVRSSTRHAVSAASASAADLRSASQSLGSYNEFATSASAEQRSLPESISDNSDARIR
mmetsp:Transcript_3735/g.14655  ORF Transcript_3735/g.14655 Transcript_3735/m.14655 type:complete len:263 (+) Transcript_3735:711-1499(+)